MTRAYAEQEMFLGFVGVCVSMRACICVHLCQSVPGNFLTLMRSSDLIYLDHLTVFRMQECLLPDCLGIGLTISHFA